MRDEAPKIWINGAKADRERATVSVLDRGFLYGDSVFETLRTYGGRPFALSEHISRLFESARRVLIPMPVTEEELCAEVTAALQECGFSEAYLRVMVTRGVGALGLDPHTCQNPTRVLIVAPLVSPPLSAYRDGIKAVTFETSRPADDTAAAGAKVGNYLVAVLAQDKARKAGAGEALIMSARGEISEGATSNLFWLSGGRLFTPPLSAGILDGITRRHILSVARTLEIAVEMSVPDLPVLLTAEAVFVSSSIREILSVIEIDGQLVGDGKVHALVTRIHEAFRQHVGAVPL